MSIIKNILIGFVVFVVAVLICGACVKVACLGRSPGTDIVVGGNTARCF